MYQLWVRFFISAGVTLPIWIAIRKIFLQIKGNPCVNKKREAILSLFISFQVALLIMVSFGGTNYLETVTGLEAARERLRAGLGVNAIPFFTIKNFYYYGSTTQIAINIIGNIGMFIPLGFFLPLLWKRWQAIWKVAIVGVVFPVLIETTQLFIGRSVDIDDVILNFIGVVLGYLIWKSLTLFKKGTNYAE